MASLADFPVDILYQIGIYTWDPEAFRNLALCSQHTSRIGQGIYGKKAREFFSNLPFSLEKLPIGLLVQDVIGENSEDDELDADEMEVVTVYFPGCGFVDGDDYNFQDYFKCDAPDKIVPSGFTGMIWAYDYCILDPYKIPVQITKEGALLKYPGLEEALSRFSLSSFGCPSKFRYWEFGIARVDKIIDTNMCDYDAKRALSAPELEEAVSLVYECDNYAHGTPPLSRSEELPQFLATENKKRIIRLEELGVVHKEKLDYQYRYGPPNWNFSCEVNSPWVYKPKKPFPKDFIFHDGRIVKCKCTGSTGNEFEYSFWGD